MNLFYTADHSKEAEKMKTVWSLCIVSNIFPNTLYQLLWWCVFFFSSVLDFLLHPRMQKSLCSNGRNRCIRLAVYSAQPLLCNICCSGHSESGEFELEKSQHAHQCNISALYRFLKRGCRFGTITLTLCSMLIDLYFVFIKGTAEKSILELESGEEK